MKKQHLLAIIFVLFQFNTTQAQENCCKQLGNKEITEIEKKLNPISNDKLKVILNEEIKLFTNYVS
jgi:hypothetical protein